MSHSCKCRFRRCGIVPRLLEAFMKRTVAISILMAASVATALAAGHAQQKPDLTGIWAAVKDAPASLPAAPMAVLGARFEIRHKGNSFTMVRPRVGFSIEATYELGGPEVRLRSPGTGCMGDAYFLEVAAWEGNGVAFTSTGVHSAGAPGPTKMNVKRILRLEAPDMLVVEGSVAQDGQQRQVGTVYKRSTEALPPLATSLPATKAAAGIADLAWVAGTWMSEPAAAGGSTTEERWTPPAGGAMFGTARTIRGTSMTAYEFLCFVERDGSLVYSAMPNGRAPATEFVLTSLTKDAATFENPSHDYPKAIKYSRRPDGSLETAISGAPNQRVVTVVLKRQ
jgi:hypothetical protein